MSRVWRHFDTNLSLVFNTIWIFVTISLRKMVNVYLLWKPYWKPYPVLNISLFTKFGELIVLFDFLNIHYSLSTNKKAELLSFVRYENDDLSILTFYNTRETLSILANCKNSLYICAEHMLQEVSSECQVLVNFKDKFGCLICVKLHVLCCPSIQCR